MKILISGSGGFIGSNLMEYLGAQPEYEPIGIKRKGANDVSFAIDLVDETSVDSFIDIAKNKNYNFDAFVHCASVLANPQNCKSFKLFQDNNIITNQVIKLVNALNVKTLINLSTIGVYPNNDGQYSEKSLVNPSGNAECLYSLSKFCSEELFDFFLKPINVNVVNLRLSQVYGEGMRSDRIYKIMEKELLEDNKITIWGNGERISNFIEIKEVIKFIIYFLNNPTSGLYNVGGKNISYLDLAHLVMKNSGVTNAEILLVDKGSKSKVFIDSSAINRLIDF
jgi:nucleoside-diphosphate-sugar epimerase